MKKIFVLLMIMIICFACFGCGEKEAPQISIDINEDMTGEDIAVTALKAYIKDGDFRTLTEGYEERTGDKGREFRITQATEYYIPDIEGRQLNLLLINADADVYSPKNNCFFDRIILLVNLEDGNVYDNYTLNTGSYMGAMETDEDILTYCLNVYNSYLMGYNEGIMTSAESDETHSHLTDEEIAAINEAVMM